MSFVYLSQGNIPSRWAHAMQTVKMAEAFSRLTKEFSFIVQVAEGVSPQNRFNYEKYYGILHQFPIETIPGESPGPTGEYEDLWYPEFYRRAVARLVVSPPDLTFTRSIEAASLLTESGLPTLLETHSVDGGAHRALIESISKRKEFLGLVTIHSLLAESYMALGVPESKICILPDGVNCESFRSPIDIREELRLEQDVPVALYTGHLYEHRGIEDIFVAAMETPQIEYVLIGGHDADLERRKNESASIPNVHLLGFKPQAMIPGYLLGADILLMPYSARQRNMNWASPLKMFEYMAASKPIVATQVPCVEDVLEHGRNAYIIEPDKGSVLAHAVRVLSEDKKFGHSLGENARKDVVEYDWQRRAKKILKYFQLSHLLR